LYLTTTNDYNRKQRKYYGEETSKCDEEADGNSSKWRQGNRVTVNSDDYNLRELVRRNKNDYDKKQASTTKYYGQETSKCDEEAEADGICSKRRRKHESKNYYPKADGEQGNRVTVKAGMTTICANRTNKLQMTMTERKQAPENTMVKKPVNATRGVRLMAIVPNGGGNKNPRITTPRQTASKEIG
jgi:hypothetical protein